MTKEVRDLYWILKGPGLLNPAHPLFKNRLLTDEWFEQQARQAELWFQRYEADPSALLNDLKNRENPTTLLGRYFEALLSFWIRDYLKPENFHAGVAVHEREPSKPGQGKNTIGEFDFIFKLAHTIHWEASVKFYLFAGESPDHARQMRYYFGTYLRDRLDIKISKIFNHQLKLSETSDGKALLDHMGLSSPRAQAWVKGMLFYPAQSDWRNHPNPDEISPHHSRGWWTETGALEDVPTESPEDRWIILPKHRWLSPAIVDPKNESEPQLYTLGEMKDHCRKHFSEHLSPLMWAEMSWDPATQKWREVNRGLVVYLGWGLAALGSLAIPSGN